MKHYLRAFGVLVVGSLLWAATCHTVEVGVDNFMFKDEFDYKGEGAIGDPLPKVKKKWEKLPDLQPKKDVD
jgi:hypothetical protein